MKDNHDTNRRQVGIPALEEMEPRRLFSNVHLHDGYLFITGTHKQDFISICNHGHPEFIEVRIGRENWRFDSAQVQRMRINGGAGDDRIGIDENAVAIIVPMSIYGADGDDTIFGGTGASRTYGGNGDDSISGGYSGDTIYGEAGDDVIHGRPDIGFLRGGDRHDHIWGGDGDDILTGSYRDDTLSGDAGDDSLNGGEGNDLIDGGAGDDSVSGDAGTDSVFGGPGNDSFSASDDPSDDMDKGIGDT